MGTRRLMKLTYERLNVRHTREVIALCNTWWYDSAFFENTEMAFISKEVYWWNLFQAGMMMGVVGRNDEGEIKSCYVATRNSYMFNNNYAMANEVVWCIDKEYRSGRNLIQLLNEIEECVKLNECKIYNLNLPLLENNDRLISKLEDRGFFKQDISMMKMVRLTRENVDG